MKILLRVMLDIIVLTILLSIFGNIYDKDPFLSLSIYLMLLAVTYFSATIITLPFSSLEYSALAVMLSVGLLGAAIVSEIVWPHPKFITPSSDEMGNHPLAEWKFQLFYEETSPNHRYYSKIFNFTGTTEESKYAVDLVIKKWNQEHPYCLIYKHFRVLTWIPIEHVKKHNYPLSRSTRY